MKELAQRFARAERQGLVDIVQAHATLPLGELLALIDQGRTGRLLGSLTVGECSEGQADDGAIEFHDKAKLREVYDSRILTALREADEPLSATEVREQVGGSAVEARTALQRLTAAKKITRTWKGRSSGYRLL